MPTPKQKRIAKLIVENAGLTKPLTGGELAENSGYSKSMQDNPKRVIDVIGVQEELEVLGFTEYAAKTVVSDILNNQNIDPNTRLKAADQVFKIKGTYAAEKKDIKVEDTTANESIKSLATILNDLQRSGHIGSDGVSAKSLDSEASD